jgi:hypothetical protein
VAIVGEAGREWGAVVEYERLLTLAGEAAFLDTVLVPKRQNLVLELRQMKLGRGLSKRGLRGFGHG